MPETPIDPRVLAAKFDSAYWPKVIHGIDIQLTAAEIAAARDLISEVVRQRSSQS